MRRQMAPSQGQWPNNSVAVGHSDYNDADANMSDSDDRRGGDTDDDDDNNNNDEKLATSATSATKRL
jgi:hypothetical protein